MVIDTNKFQLSTTSKENGAIAIWYPGVKERIATIVKGDYYVVFFESWNNVMILPVEEYSAKRIKDTIKRMEPLNTEFVLSKKVYRYHSATGELKVVE